MRRLPAALAALFAITLSLAAPDPPAAKITYIANAGFLIEIGSGKVLIDAIFNDQTIGYAHVPETRTLERMESAAAPFDDVDLILVTHGHRDHFAAGPVLRHLAANPRAVLVAPPQAVEQLRVERPRLEALGDRINEVRLELLDSAEMTLGGIRLEAHRLRHSKYMVTDEKTGKTYDRHEGVENLAYEVEIEGIRLFHIGDAVLSQNLDHFNEERFPEPKVKIAFLEFFDWSEETKEFLERRLAPDHVVFMHLPPQKEQIEKLTRRLSEQFPNAVVFQEPLERRSF